MKDDFLLALGFRWRRYIQTDLFYNAKFATVMTTNELYTYLNSYLISIIPKFDIEYNTVVNTLAFKEKIKMIVNGTRSITHIFHISHMEPQLNVILSMIVK